MLPMLLAAVLAVGAGQGPEATRTEPGPEPDFWQVVVIYEDLFDGTVYYTDPARYLTYERAKRVQAEIMAKGLVLSSDGDPKSPTTGIPPSMLRRVDTGYVIVNRPD